MSPSLLTYRGAVYPWHCDHMGHMNVMWYVGKFDEATWQLFCGLGLTPRWLQAHGRGMAAVEQTLQYRRELHAGAVVSIHSDGIELMPKAIRVVHEMRNDETAEVAAVCTLTAIHLDTVARKAVALPPHVAGSLAALGDGAGRAPA